MLRWRALAIILALSPASCQRGCGSGVSLAQLVSQRGDVTAETQSGKESWHPVETGFAFFEGDALRTGVGSKATVGLGVRGSLQVGSESIVRFGAKGNGKSAGVSVEEGEAILEGATGDLYFQTDIGVALLEAGTQARMSQRDGGVRVDVLVGAAVFERDGHEDVRIERGEGVAIDVGSAVLEKTSTPADPAAPAAPAAPTDNTDNTDNTDTTVKTEDARDAGTSDVGMLDAASNGLDGRVDRDGSGATGDETPAGIVLDRGLFELSVRGANATIVQPGSGAIARISPAGKRLRAEPGTKVLLKKSTTAVVRRAHEEAKIQGPAEVVLGEATGPILLASMGRVTYAASATADVSVQVPGGLATASAPGSRAELEISRQGSAVATAAAGQVLLSARGETTTLSFGERAMLTQRGLVRFMTKNPTTADFTITAGESVTIHDALAPTAIGFDFSRSCPQGARVELAPAGGSFRRAHGKASGTGRAILSVQPGRHRYRVTCSAPTPASGTGASSESVSPPSADASGRSIQGALRIVRDSGRARLPSSSASNTIDADGRRYTILYQSLLPRLVFSWRRAPLGRSFVLTIAPTEGSPNTYSSSTPSYAFASGQVPEGEYRFWWTQTDGSQRRSPETTLKLDFDNAAPSMSLRSPPVRITADASTVLVEGAAVPGATVSISGQTIELDRHLRFRAEARPNPGEIAVAIRIEHPRRGVHYYLRKLPGAAKTETTAHDGPP
ncbi:MAG: hypothetical protein IPK13_25605 [Deltaproteobacteria bacterium]|nr:hypothetical protein [Deltaproteobacteria bacterium]